MMKKTQKLQRVKVGGNAFGMVEKINRIFFALMLLIFVCCSGNRKAKTPIRDSKIPESAEWHGGLDGGTWIDIDTTEIPNQFHIQCYFDSDGSLWENGIFMLDSLTIPENYSIRKLHDIITGFGGDFWFHPQMRDKNPNFVFREIKNYSDIQDSLAIKKFIP